MNLGKGTATAITDADYASLAASLKCHPADLEAIAQVESKGFGWFADGRMKILYEKHWFYKLIPEAKRANAVKNGLARKSWVSPAKGGYKDQDQPNDRYKLLERAIKVDEEAAFKSVSMGTFQIMGFNHKLCGHQSAKQMFEKFCESEAYQLSAFAGFLVSNKLDNALRRGDFDAVETGYNGDGLNGAYAKKMRAASVKLRAGKWADWDNPQQGGAKPIPSVPAKPPTNPPPSGPNGQVWTQQPKGNSAGWIVALAVAIAGAITGLVTGGWEWLMGLFG